ncbi:MAG: hypothetical protein M3552_06720 [Planctomycetota bacterium]|nr:hypothetical protein [Planctomycetaceae bacterium]MDQ3330330.1 hypothetical protein [Planctomycetota bacterium]
MTPASKLLTRMLKAVVAFVLLYSGLVHAAQPYYFVHAAAAYRILPPSVVGPLMIFLPYLQIAIALCLIVGTAERAVLLLAFFIFSVFATAQAIVMARGESLSCGCFGFSEATIGPSTLAIPILGGIICLVLLRGVRRVPSAEASPDSFTDGPDRRPGYDLSHSVCGQKR